MANNYTTNPIVLDTFTANVDIAKGTYGNTAAPMFVENIVYDGLTATNHVMFKDKDGNPIQAHTCQYSGRTDHERPLGQPWQGLQMFSADQTVTTGKVYIYLR